MKDVSFWTGYMPLELTIARLHRTFMLGLKDDDIALANLSRCVAHIALGLASPLVDIGVDRQIFQDGLNGAIIVLNPFCRRPIIPLYTDDAFT
jgi:hypothetical protein